MLNQSDTYLLLLQLFLFKYIFFSFPFIAIICANELIEKKIFNDTLKQSKETNRLNMKQNEKKDVAMGFLIIC